MGTELEPRTVRITSLDGGGAKPKGSGVRQDAVRYDPD
jgi:hypothetical protein